MGWRAGNSSGFDNFHRVLFVEPFATRTINAFRHNVIVFAALMLLQNGAALSSPISCGCNPSRAPLPSGRGVPAGGPFDDLVGASSGGCSSIPLFGLRQPGPLASAFAGHEALARPETRQRSAPSSSSMPGTCSVFRRSSSSPACSASPARRSMRRAWKPRASGQFITRSSGRWWRRAPTVVFILTFIGASTGSSCPTSMAGLRARRPDRPMCSASTSTARPSATSLGLAGFRPGARARRADVPLHRGGIGDLARAPAARDPAVQNPRGGLNAEERQSPGRRGHPGVRHNVLSFTNASSWSIRWS